MSYRWSASRGDVCVVCRPWGTRKPGFPGIARRHFTCNCTLTTSCKRIRHPVRAPDTAKLRKDLPDFGATFAERASSILSPPRSFDARSQGFSAPCISSSGDDQLPKIIRQSSFVDNGNGASASPTPLRRERVGRCCAYTATHTPNSSTTFQRACSSAARMLSRSIRVNSSDHRILWIRSYLLCWSSPHLHPSNSGTPCAPARGPNAAVAAWQVSRRVR